MDLKGQIALVAGATRGAGRGIARALAEAGATVYCTGRSTAGKPSPYKRPETIDETAAMIAAAGGHAIAVRVDHAVEAEVEALAARIVKEQGRLDILVNSIAGEDPLMGQWASFWKVNLAKADQALRQSLVSHIITAKHVAPIMIERKRGLIVEITENDSLGGGGNPLAWSVKLAIKGLALNMASELHSHGVTAVAITPGFLRSESMLEGKKRHRGELAGRREGRQQLPGVRVAVVRRPGGGGAGRRSAHVRTHRPAVELVGAQPRLRFHRCRRPAAGLGRARNRLLDLPPSFLEMFRTGLRLQQQWLGRLQENTARLMGQLPPEHPSTRGV